MRIKRIQTVLFSVVALFLLTLVIKVNAVETEFEFVYNFSQIVKFSDETTAFSNGNKVAEHKTISVTKTNKTKTITIRNDYDTFYNEKEGAYSSATPQFSSAKLNASQLDFNTKAYGFRAVIEFDISGSNPVILFDGVGGINSSITNYSYSLNQTDTPTNFSDGEHSINSGFIIGTNKLYLYTNPQRYNDKKAAPTATLKLKSFTVKETLEETMSQKEIIEADIDNFISNAEKGVKYNEIFKTEIDSINTLLTAYEGEQIDSEKITQYNNYVSQYLDIRKSTMDKFITAVGAIDINSPMVVSQMIYAKNLLTLILSDDLSDDYISETYNNFNTLYEERNLKFNENKETYSLDYTPKIEEGLISAGVTSINFTGHDYQLGNSIFQLYNKSSSVMFIETHDKSPYDTRIRLNGQITFSNNAAKAIKFTTLTSGTLKVIGITSTNGVARIANIYETDENLTSGTIVEQGSQLTFGDDFTTLEFKVPNAGNYAFGTTGGGANIYYIEFIPDTLIQSQHAEDNTKHRIIGTISDVNIEDIEYITLKLTLDGFEKEIDITKVYESVNGEKEVIENTYYVVFTIDGLLPSGTDGASTYTLSMQLEVLIDGVVHLTQIKTVTIHAIPNGGTN